MEEKRKDISISNKHIVKLSVALIITSGISQLLQILNNYAFSFIIEVISLTIIFLFVLKQDQSGDFLGLDYTNLRLLILSQLIISLPFWISECLSFFSLTVYRRAIGTFSFSTLVKAPIFEELFFRGILLAYLLGSTNENIAVVITSVLYSVIHLPVLFLGINAFSLTILVGTFILGVILAKIQIRSKNILIPIFIHFLMNLCLIILPLSFDPIIVNQDC